MFDESSICTIDYTPVAENGFIPYDGLLPDN